MNSQKIKYLPVLLAVAALGWACQGDGGSCPSSTGGTGQGEGGAILLRSAAEGPGTRAVAGFPNETIGVTATYATSPTDWTLYDDLLNAPANVTGVTGGVYSFEWDTQKTNQKYWPFDGASLIFAAYSPHTSESDAIELLNDNTHLVIQLQDDTPDVMYATGNGAAAWSKTSPAPVDLGTFNHALSELTINVAGDDSFNPGITLSSLKVETDRGTALLDLLGADNTNLSFLIGPEYDYRVVYNLAAAGTVFSKQDPYSVTVYLFPGTGDNTRITAVFKDSSYSYEVSYMLSEIPFDNDPSRYLTLVRAANTQVNFTVRSTSVENPREGITLQGRLTDWIDKGDLEVTIN